jgi:hypothetical protein
MALRHNPSDEPIALFVFMVIPSLSYGVVAWPKEGS